jgi:hypothetical protein
VPDSLIGRRAIGPAGPANSQNVSFDFASWRDRRESAVNLQPLRAKLMANELSADP